MPNSDLVRIYNLPEIGRICINRLFWCYTSGFTLVRYVPNLAYRESTFWLSRMAAVGRSETYMPIIRMRTIDPFQTLNSRITGCHKWCFYDSKRCDAYGSPRVYDC